MTTERRRGPEEQKVKQDERRGENIKQKESKECKRKKRNTSRR
jgi:hypothetical protein